MHFISLSMDFGIFVRRLVIEQDVGKEQASTSNYWKNLSVMFWTWTAVILALIFCCFGYSDTEIKVKDQIPKHITERIL
ncbi:hypothetical protein ACJX0J_010341, partial [Zea mays]